MNLKTKVATGVATATMLASVFAPVVLAADLEIKGNGNQSENEIEIKKSIDVSITQGNVTDATVEVESVANSGGNTVKENVGGTNSIDTGDATSKVKVTITGGDNTLVLPDCLCEEHGYSVLVSNNGNKSENEVEVEDKKKLTTTQGNTTKAGVGVGSIADTGYNKVKKNVGSGSSITTGKAKSKVKVRVAGGSNFIGPVLP